MDTGRKKRKGRKHERKAKQERPVEGLCLWLLEPGRVWGRKERVC